MPLPSWLRQAARWLRASVARPTLKQLRGSGLAVVEGPFRGIRYPWVSVPWAPQIGARIAGTYERELHSVIEEVVAARPKAMVEIGAADGYYVAGLTRRVPSTRIVAFEMDPFMRWICHRMSVANGVSERVELRGECTLESLSALDVPPGSFVLCDCEGAEEVLIDPDRVSWLRGTALLVEVHEALAPGVCKALESRFDSTHRLRWITTEPRSQADWPHKLRNLPLSGRERELLLSERRPWPMAWLWARPFT